MKALLDTNIFLEIILSQEHAEEAKRLLLKSAQHELFITDYSLHSIGLLLFRKKQHEAFRAFVDDVLLNGGFGLLSLFSDEMEAVISASQRFGLDFDDAYQYAIASGHDLVLVSLDTDFQRTDRGHKTPSEILQVISQESKDDQIHWLSLFTVWDRIPARSGYIHLPEGRGQPRY